MSETTEKGVADLLMAHLYQTREGDPSGVRASPRLEAEVTKHVQGLDEADFKVAIRTLTDAAASIKKRGADAIAQRITKLAEGLRFNPNRTVSVDLSADDGFDAGRVVFCATDWMDGIGSYRPF